MTDLNALLARQLRRSGADAASPPSAEAWVALLGTISRTYASNEQDRYLLERSLDLTSQEMQRLYGRIAEERDRLKKELEIATVLQTSILPPPAEHRILDVAATMIPTTEVGGDYYDVVSTDDACWIGIGDVAGHGLRTAMIMMMLQSVVAAMVRAKPRPLPSAVLEVANRALWDNVRKRLSSDEHVTCTLLACTGDGVVQYAGAHEDILIARAAGGACVRVETPGTWLCAVPDIAAKNPDQRLVLAAGDVMVLFTDGVTEARNDARVQFGLDRLTDVIERHRAEPVAVIRDAIVAAVQAWMPKLDDDVTVVVTRYRA